MWHPAAVEIGPMAEVTAKITAVQIDLDWYHFLVSIDFPPTFLDD